MCIWSEQPLQYNQGYTYTPLQVSKINPCTLPRRSQLFLSGNIVILFWNFAVLKLVKSGVLNITWHMHIAHRNISLSIYFTSQNHSWLKMTSPPHLIISLIIDGGGLNNLLKKIKNIYKPKHILMHNKTITKIYNQCI